MGVPAAAIRDLAQLDDALAGSDAEPVVVLIDAPVPSWLGEAVRRVRRSGRPLRVHLADGGDGAGGQDPAGREIGMVVAVLDAGVHPDEIEGVAPQRVRRVAEVLDRWGHASVPRSDIAADPPAEGVG